MSFTRMRRPRIQGRPPQTLGSEVMRLIELSSSRPDEILGTRRLARNPKPGQCLSRCQPPAASTCSGTTKRARLMSRSGVRIASPAPIFKPFFASRSRGVFHVRVPVGYQLRGTHQIGTGPQLVPDVGRQVGRAQRGGRVPGGGPGPAPVGEACSAAVVNKLGGRLPLKTRYPRPG